MIAGGGIAGLELAMALRDLAGARPRITLVAPDTHFVLKPLAVREPFGGPGLERHELAPLLERIDAEHVRDAVTAVNTEARAVTLRGARKLDYDVLAVCVGGAARPAYTAATTFWSTSARIPVDDLVTKATAHPSGTLAVIVPPATTWPLPAYELALMLRRHAEEEDGVHPAIELITPEPSPLAIFGASASAAVAARLRVRDIEVRASTAVDEVGGELRLRDGEALDVGAAIALPRIDGPAIPGLPADEHGFIPVDEHLRVVGVESVYAAGDGASFPVKQGGIAAQQADAAAEHIAAVLGEPIEARPFKPVLRGELLTDSDSLKFKHELTGGDEGTLSPDYLWWPRAKVGARYVAAWLAGVEPEPDLSPREMPIEVEASWPHEWHGVPM